MLEIKPSNDYWCISCCDKNKPTKEISISRDGSSHKGENIITFNLCNDCLRKLAIEFRPFS